MATPIKTVALCSPIGKLGPFLLAALEAEGFAVSVVLRESSKATFASSQQISKVSDEYRENSPEASIKASNRWLIPSTYGPNIDDPRADVFPASVPYRQALQDLRELQKGQTHWAWSSISCGPWAETAIAAGAWLNNPGNKTAEVLDEGHNVFTSSTHDQVALAVARILKRQPAGIRNQNVFVAAFEVDMATWLGAHKQVLGADRWEVTSTDTNKMVESSQQHLAAGQFIPGCIKSALAVTTGQGFQSHLSKVGTLANEELDLSKEDLIKVVQHSLTLPSPFE